MIARTLPADYRRTIISLGCGLLLFIVATPLWRPLLGTALVVADPLAPADAILPLTGGYDRARYAAALWVQGYARWFIASDTKFVGPYGRLGSDMNGVLAIEEGVLPWHIYETRQVVRSTYTELQAIRDLAQRQGWRSLIVVTDPLHTRRARLIADDVFRGSGIAVTVRPVPGADLAAWWQSDEQRRMVGLEYAKIAAFLAGYRGR